MKKVLVLSTVLSAALCSSVFASEKAMDAGEVLERTLYAVSQAEGLDLSGSAKISGQILSSESDDAISFHVNADGSFVFDRKAGGVAEGSYDMSVFGQTSADDSMKSYIVLDEDGNAYTGVENSEDGSISWSRGGMSASDLDQIPEVLKDEEFAKGVQDLMDNGVLSVSEADGKYDLLFDLSMDKLNNSAEAEEVLDTVGEYVGQSDLLIAAEAHLYVDIDTMLPEQFTMDLVPDGDSFGSLSIGDGMDLQLDEGTAEVVFRSFDAPESLILPDVDYDSIDTDVVDDSEFWGDETESETVSFHSGDSYDVTSSDGNFIITFDPYEGMNGVMDDSPEYMYITDKNYASSNPSGMIYINSGEYYVAESDSYTDRDWTLQYYNSEDFEGDDPYVSEVVSLIVDGHDAYYYYEQYTNHEYNYITGSYHVNIDLDGGIGVVEYSAIYSEGETVQLSDEGLEEFLSHIHVTKNGADDVKDETETVTE